MAKLAAKLPVAASIGADRVVPLSVIDTLPEGINDPALIVPAKIVGVWPKTMVGAARLPRTGAAGVMVIDPDPVAFV